MKNEVNSWSVTWGVLMAILFSAAAAYLGLKVGQVFEAAIPIAIIAVGVSTAAKRSNALRENVIIQSIGACSGAVVAGAIFTLPAIYILQAKYPEMSADFLKIFIASLLGGVLGILFLIPFRRYFVEAPQEQFPFPEATATTQVLKSGDKGSSQAKPLLIAGLVGGLYDFIVATFGWWNENVTSRMIPFGDDLAEKTKLVFKNNTGAAVLGLGYIIGFRYALIITLGSLFVWWLVVPGMALLFPDTVLNQWNPAIDTAVGDMSPELIFTSYGKSIGIGAIAMAGIIGIIKSWGVIKSAVGLATKAGSAAESQGTIQQDLPFKFIAIAATLTLILTFLFFWFGVMDGNLLFALVAIILTAVIAFLFTTVAANAIAIVGSNPVSGMTLMTLILASVVMVGVGLKGTGGMVAALIMGGVVCTALSMAGSFITDLKIGYWCGTQPKKQETWKFLGTLVSAATVGGVMMLLNETYGFASGALAAPQANAMAAVIDPLMNGVGAPWPLYALGAIIAVVLTFFKVPALAFALGMFIQRPEQRGHPQIPQTAGAHPLERCFREQGPWRERQPHCLWFHCRWRPHGSHQCPAPFRWYPVRLCPVVDQSTLRTLQFGSLYPTDSLLYPRHKEVTLQVVPSVSAHARKPFRTCPEAFPYMLGSLSVYAREPFYSGFRAFRMEC